MTATIARDAMCKVFLDAWVAAGYDAANVRWDDVPSGVPTTEIVWARVSVKHADGNQRTFGDTRTFENTGVLWVQVFAPVGGGNVAGYAAAQTVVNAFRDSKNILVWFRNARMREVGVSGAFEQINVLTDFTYDDLR